MASVAYASTTGDDSDTDVVTDFLNSNCAVESTGNVGGDTNTREVRKSLKTVESQNYCIPIINAPPSIKNTSGGISLTTNNNIENTNSSNMIPTINVTPHSPASISKYNNIFEDTLCQLQNIRESVVQMKNSSAHMHDNLSNYGLLNAAILSASLPDLSATNSTSGNTPHGLAQFMMWSSAQQQYLLSTDRRKSWTAVDDLTTGGDCTNKSVSLSSLDSEEQETIRVTEQRRRSARNSTGGISTHSLNEAELVRDFERITTKRNLATEIISRIPLQKSISTSSIIAKDDIKAIARHLTDSEDENQSLLRAHAKIEVYDTVEKRRKRGSLFFRKKKDKSKMKAVSGQACQICESCGANISFTSARDHQIECKGKKAIVQKGLGGSTVNKKGTNDAGQDMFDGGTSCLNEQSTNFNDDTPLIRSEFYNDAPVEAQDLGADPSLGIALKEYDSWSPGVSKEILKNLKELQIKRQEHIYEFIMTEKHHCQTLLVMQKVFVESMERYFPSFNINGMFPRLAELTDLHTGFLKKLRHKQREQAVVDSIADILLDFFTMEKAQQLRLAYGEFCANHRTALEQFKMYLTSRDPNFAEWYKHCLSNPLLKKKGIPECILFVTQRLTKYPLLIEPLLKSSRDDKMEQDKLTHALNLVKALLVDVDACVAEKELRERQIAIFQRTDAKSFSIYKNKPFRKSDIGVESRRRLKFEGLATLMQGRSKMQAVLVVVLTDCLCFLSENSAHNKYTFFTPENKAGVVPLQKLLIREKAGTESRGIYIISSNPSFPEMYELKVQQPKDKNVWIQSIRQAVLECPSSELLENEDLTAEEKLRIGVNKREIIEKMRQKDIEQALLLEEKLMLQVNLLKEQQQQFGSDQSAILSNSSAAASATNFLSTFGSYKDLVSADCDTTDLWKRVQNSVQEISQLASTVYTAATGVPVPRLISTVGDVQTEHNSSPTLPKRAETFAGFDEKRVQRAFPAKLAALQVMTPRLQELEEKRQPKGSSSSLIPSLISSGNSSDNYNNSAAANTAAAIAEPQKENHFTILQVSHHLQTLLCIICQQMTTIHSLQLQLALYRESPRSTYIHNDQLEELRNLQDKLQEEKTAWLKLKEQQEQDLKEMSEQQEKLQIQIKAEQEDIKQQREQLYRKMELLSNQGLLLSPNTPLMLTNTPTVSTSSNDDSHDGIEHNLQSTSFDTQTIGINSNGGGGSSTVDRRKDKWRTASTMTKGPPVHLISATNAPKLNQTSVKQKIPIKLSSHSSSMTPSGTGTGYSKTEKSGSTNVNTIGVVTQLFPLKLADKRPHTPSPSTSTSSSSLFSTQLTPQHSRTGSSPAIIQHPSSNMPSASVQTPPVTVTRTDSSSTYTYGQRNTATPTTSKNSTGNFKKSTSTSQNKTLKTDEEEIYF